MEQLLLLWLDRACGVRRRVCKLVSGIAELKVEAGQMDGQNQQVCCLQQSRVVRGDDVSTPKGGEREWDGEGGVVGGGSSSSAVDVWHSDHHLAGK